MAENETADSAPLFAPPRPVQSRGMHRAVLSVCLGLTLFAPAFFVPAAAAQSQTFEYSGRGEWSQVSASATTQPADVPTLDRVEELLRQNRSKSAEKLAVDWVLSHKGN